MPKKPIRNYGLLLPHRGVLVLSVIAPISGALTASHILLTRTAVPVKVGLNLTTSVKNIR